MNPSEAHKKRMRHRQPTHLSDQAKAELRAYQKAWRRGEVPPERSDETRAELTELARIRRERR